jgi:hypothetical protein
MPVPLLVRNKQAGPTVFTDKPSETEVRWEGADDVAGGDIMQVPASLAENLNFTRALRLGILEVVQADDETQELLDRQTAAWNARQTRDAEAVQESIDPSAQQDYIELSCIGPNNRGNGECGQPVVVKESHKDEKAPLCPQHEHLSNQYVVTATDKLVEGKAQVKWQHMPTTAAERQSQSQAAPAQ